MKATIDGKSSDDDRVFTKPKARENATQTVVPFSPSSESSSEEEPESDDGFRWVNRPLEDVTGVECRKFIADELNIDPSSPFLLDILSDQPRVAAPIPAAAPMRVSATRLSSPVPEDDEWETFTI